MLDLILGNANPSQVRNTADGFSINSHGGSFRP